MFQRVQKKLEELHMVSQGDLVLVGVSGGADSVALLLVLHGLKEEMGFSLEVLHVEHGIRGEESLKDAAFVKDLCERLQVPCHEIAVDVPDYCKKNGLGTEEAARILRYEAFSKLATEAGAKVALAHHMEDNAETILFQMARGSSLTGLCGMQPVRVDGNGVVYIRPLLFLHRDEIETFLGEQDQSYCIDSTNVELDYKRNYIRNEVLPKLSQVNDQAVSHINQTATQMSLFKNYLDLEVEKYWDETVSKEDVPTVDVAKLKGLHLALQQQIAYRAISETAGVKKDISAVHVEEVLSLCENQSGREIHLPYGIVVKKEYDKLRLYKDAVKEQKKSIEVFVSPEVLEESLSKKEIYEVVLGDSGEKLVVKVFAYDGDSAQIPQKTYTKWLDYDKINKGFCIRTRQSGDYLISDALGHHKKLKQYFIDEKIPAAERNGMWLLAQENEVLWLIGGRISEHVKVTDDTKTVIELKYVGGK